MKIQFTPGDRTRLNEIFQQDDALANFLRYCDGLANQVPKRNGALYSNWFYGKEDEKSADVIAMERQTAALAKASTQLLASIEALDHWGPLARGLTREMSCQKQWLSQTEWDEFLHHLRVLNKNARWRSEAPQIPGRKGRRPWPRIAMVLQNLRSLLMVGGCDWKNDKLVAEVGEILFTAFGLPQLGVQANLTTLKTMERHKAHLNEQSRQLVTAEFVRYHQEFDT